MPDIAHAPDQIGLLHENYPHVLAATFRFNAYFAHQAPILYYIFLIISIAQIVKYSYNFRVAFMHIIQYVCNISQNSASAQVAEACFFIIFVKNAYLQHFCSFKLCINRYRSLYSTPHQPHQHSPHEVYRENRRNPYEAIQALLF